MITQTEIHTLTHLQQVIQVMPQPEQSKGDNMMKHSAPVEINRSSPHLARCP